MKRTYSTVILLLSAVIIIVLINDCSDFGEENLSDKVVVLRAPADSLVTTLTSHTFWWDYVEGAEGYNLQIVMPSFDRTVRLVLDTNLTTNRFDFTLYPGSFEWGVSAYNYSSATAYTINKLMIDTTSDLSHQYVVLKTPAENYNTNNITVHFQWYMISSATDYRFEIRRSAPDGQLVSPAQLTDKDTISAVLAEGVYYWGVQAQNSNSGSVMSNRKLVVDTTVPDTPILLEPAKNDTLTTTPVILKWDRPTASTAEIRDSVIIASDTTASGSIIESALTNDPEYTMKKEDNGIYYWKVRSIDLAGNKSNYSKYRKFTIEK